MENIEQRIDALLAQMSLEEKITLCSGGSGMGTAALPERGILPLEMSDGPNGVRSTGQPGGENTTGLPTGIALAASFDTDLAEKYGQTIALDSKALGIGVSLGPGLNLMRTPLCGRNFEYYGEDPVLAGKIGVGYVRGCQKEKVAATPKHLALNNQEICRTTGSSEIDERTLRELYLTAFEIITKEAHPWMMMSSYNRINGTYASQNGQTQELIVKREWGFDGVMVSDWGGVHDTIGPMLGGLDLEMPGPGNQLTVAKLLHLFENGILPVSVLDDKVRRILRLLCRTGAIDHSIQEGVCGGATQLATAREAAGKCIVLLKNENSLLPLDTAKIRKILVTGPNADYRHHRGNIRIQGGSGAVFTEREVTPLAGLRKFADANGIDLQYMPSIKFDHDRRCPEGFFGEEGIFCTYYADEQSMAEEKNILFERKNFDGLFEFETTDNGTVATKDSQKDFLLPASGFALRMNARITIPECDKNARLLFTVPAGQGKAWINGELVWEKNNKLPLNYGFTYPVNGAGELSLKMEYSVTNPMWAHLRIDWIDPQNDADTADKVLAAAKEADLVIFCGGRNKIQDKEAIGWGDVPNADIESLTMPGEQDEFISRLAGINKNVIVTLNGGSTIDVEKWIDQVPALLQLWYPGEAGGDALADILSGKENPSARLPFTWAKKLEDYPCHANGNYPGNRKDENPIVRYDEGIFMGYRHFDRENIAPRFPFGFGLGYSEFTMNIADFAQTGDTVFDAGCTLSAAVKNVSARAGSETVQIYVGAVDPEFPRPVKELKAFAKVELAPGESKTVDFKLNWRDFAAFHPDKHHWGVTPGTYRIILARDAGKIIESREITFA